MSDLVDLLIKDGTVVNHDGIDTADIAVSAGRITAIGRALSCSAAETIEASGLHILPGVIDSQVHFREPGLEQKEDLETGSRAAVLGGVTSVFEMPNTNPLTTSPEALADKVKRARNRMFCDFAFYVGGTRENIGDIASLEKREASAGIKVFMGSSTGNLLVEDEPSLDRIVAALSRRAAFHAEDEDRLIARMDVRRPGDPSSHPDWRDEETALLATQRIVRLAEKHCRRIHVLHVTTAEEMTFLALHKTWATVEVTPQHLTLSAPDCYERLGTYAQMNPPIRTERHRKALWQAVAAGVVDVLGSDHAPHTREEKDHPYPGSHSGMPGVQTLVPIMLDHVAQGHLSLARFVDLTAHGPARIFGIADKGRIAVGNDADLTIVDLKRTKTIRNDLMASRCGWTPYDNQKVTGWPVGTIIRGRRVMWDGEILGTASGAPVKFHEAGL